MKSQLTELQEKYVELMLDGVVRTNQAYADILGCDIRTVYKMKQNEKISLEIERRADITLKASLSNAYGVLEHILFSGGSSNGEKLKALDLYLKTQGKLKEKQDIDTTVVVKDSNTAALELDRLLGL
ncbi:phBC6A51 family helix-turn-helix protein [Bacillus toyonensis]|nr:phBC6A51 family helix-turn-helix protein [Bacillus toyonensis]